MTTAINLLLNNDVLRLSLGKQAKIDSENYSVDKIYKNGKRFSNIFLQFFKLMCFGATSP